jgi:predicted transcriptional regulator
LTPHIVGLVNDAQDALIRDAIIENGATIIDEEISVDACIAYLDDAAKGNRVTGEYLAKWFTETYLDAAMQFVCAMSKFDAESLTPDQIE